MKRPWAIGWQQSRMGWQFLPPQPGWVTDALLRSLTWEVPNSQISRLVAFSQSHPLLGHLPAPSHLLAFGSHNAVDRHSLVGATATVPSFSLFFRQPTRQLPKSRHSAYENSASPDASEGGPRGLGQPRLARLGRRCPASVRAVMLFDVAAAPRLAVADRLTETMPWKQLVRARLLSTLSRELRRRSSQHRVWSKPPNPSRFPRLLRSRSPPAARLAHHQPVRVCSQVPSLSTFRRPALPRSWFQHPTLSISRRS